MWVMDEVCITFSESDVDVFPLELFCESLPHSMDICEQPILHLPDVTVLHPTHEVRTAEDHPNFSWGLCFRSIILRPRPSVIHVILQVPTANELLYLIFESDVLLSGITDTFMEPAVLILVPLVAVSM